MTQEKDNLNLVEINQEINEKLGDDQVKRALLETTFNGLNPESMKKAIFEARMRGFTFEDFLKKDVYAVPYGQGYSLVESIGRCRKIGARSGITGKSEPHFTYKTDESIDSCSVTVYKRGGHPDGYTATVKFDEYRSNKKIWNEKPHTMIAKVAEMHALRMACPEELSESYIEEEFAKPPQHDIRARVADSEEEAPTMKSLTNDNDNHHGGNQENSDPDEPSEEEKARIREEERREAEQE